MMFTVILKENGNNKLGVVKAIMALTGIGLPEAKKIADTAPCTVASSLTESEANRIKAGLEACGATVGVESEVKASAEPPRLSDVQRPPLAVERTQNSGKPIPITRFFMLRAGIVTDSATGDFLDNLSPELGFAVAFCDSRDARMVICHEQLGTMIYTHDDFREAISSLSQKVSQSKLRPAILSGLLKSTLDRDADGLVDVDEGYEESFFEATETDDVEDYTPCFFGIGSVTDDISDLTFDVATKRVTHEGAVVNTLTKLFGRLDEDESWVVGIRT